MMRSSKQQSPVIVLRKVAPSLAVASTLVLSSFVGLSRASVAERDLIFREAGISPTGPLIAQQVVETIVAYETRDYAVRVFRDENGQPRMNVFDKAEGLLRVDSLSTTLTVRDGKPVYLTPGDYSGRQADYVAELFANDFARLVIVDGSGSVIASQDAEVINAFNVPDSVFEQTRNNNILAFQTSSYAVRVFERDGQRFMNVYNKFTTQQELNGKAASLVDPAPPYEDAVSYVASGERSGQPVRYFARIDGQGRTILEIENVNGQRLFQEIGTGEVIVNIPAGDLPPGVDNINRVNDAYVAAVFGGEDTLLRVQQEFPEAFIDTSARQGDFINAGAFPSHDAAMLRVLELRSEGFHNARVVFRDVRYR